MHGAIYGTHIGVLSTSNFVFMKCTYYVMILGEKPKKNEIFTIIWFLLVVAHLYNNNCHEDCGICELVECEKYKFAKLDFKLRNF